MDTDSLLIKKLQYEPKLINKVADAWKTEYEIQYNVKKDNSDNILRYCNDNFYVMLENKSLRGFFNLCRYNIVTSNSFIEIIISVIISFIFGRIFIYDFCILPHYRNYGYGSKMLQLVKKYCKENLIYIRFLELHTFNKKLLKFYTRNGFQIISQKNNIYILQHNLYV
jgi:ribosomal protein S18 acetylase RimI-like enzyme